MRCLRGVGSRTCFNCGRSASMAVVIERGVVIMKLGWKSLSRGMLNVAFVVLACSGAVYAQGTAPRVPEIDAGSAASALTLVVGAALFLKDKFRVK